MSGNPYPVDSSGVELADVDIADDFLQRLAAVEAAMGSQPSSDPTEQWKQLKP